MRRGRETLGAALVGLAALAVYLRTLYPGLVGSGDTPELQFVGRVLGTAHTPGYPLYVVLSWAFSHLPLGSVAYRINLMSAVCAAAAAATAFLICRQIGARPMVAAAVALALAFGRVFWSQATLAEVYTLAAALLLAMVACVLAWESDRRPAMLLAAFALAALGLGHHYSDIVTVAPALVLYVLLSDARPSLRTPTFIAGAVILALGLAQYGFLLLRTHQHAPYLAAAAGNLGELAANLRGGRFGARLFAFDLGTILGVRLPAFARLLFDEVGPAGLGLLVLGAAVLLRRRPRLLGLFLLGAAGPAFFALNYDVPDIGVFLLPSLLLLWPLAAVGLEALVAAAPAGPVAVLAGALALALPAAQLAANYRTNDHHTRSFEMRYFGALAEMLPERSAIVTESYTVDQMIRYQLFGEGFEEKKEVALAGRDAASLDAYRRKGYALFAFEKGRQELTPLGYRFAPVTLRDGALDDFLRVMPAGAIVVLAASGGPGVALGALGAGSLPARSRCVAVGVAGARAGGLVRCDAEAADTSLGAGDAIGGTGVRAPSALRAASRRTGALVEVNGRPVARVDVGIALAVVGVGGRPLDRIELDAEDDPRVPFNRRAFPLYRLTGGPDCADVGNTGFVDVTSVAAGGRVLGRIDDFKPFEAHLVVYLARDRPLSPRLGEVAGRGVPHLEVRDFENAVGRPDAGLLAVLDADGVPRQAWAAARHVARVEVRVDDQGESSAFALDLGGVPERALARGRVDLDNPKRAQVCALLAGGAELLGDDAQPWARLALGPDGAGYFGDGWHAPERDGPDEFRWTAAPEAELLLPLARIGTIRVQVLARPPEDALPAGTIDLRLGRVTTEARALRPGWASYEWTVPASAWRLGTNPVIVRTTPLRGPTSRDPRALGVAVGQIRLRLVSPR